MPATHYWLDDEKTIYCMKLSDKWNWGDYSLTIREGHAAITTVDHHVDLVMWFETDIPRGNALPHIKRAGATQPPNTRHTVFVNKATRLLETLASVVAKSHNWVGPKHVKTLEEALDYLNTLRASELEANDN